MPRLRMKPSTSTEEAVLSAQRRARRESHRKRQRHKTESISPPRNPPPPCGDEFDESSLPPEQAYKRTRTIEEEEEEFEERLRDAAREDGSREFIEESMYARQVPAYASYYGNAAGVAAGVRGGGGGGEMMMDEEEYAEYVRAGMWRRKNREEVERIERMEKERKAKEERERKENVERDRLERERIRRLEEKRKRRNREEDEKSRQRYEVAWQKLQQMNTASAKMSTADDGTTKTSTNQYPLQFTDFPWPIFPPVAFPPLSWPSSTDLTVPSLTSFLLPSSLSSEQRRQKLRSTVLAYHPDRFERYVLKIPEEKEETRYRVRELGLRTSQLLNELMKSEKSKD